ncbi:dienelactone hydrolase-like protein [Caballeronia pedi]|uniref:Dienelactone hydrolase-like protein n=1 Tax=Caballeronia pedi TaxID=1777141 RepID=A0A158CGW4_9BURK|nr:dienelactone hydrolase [Caballeronia pedi]SAK81628.1 dienelactone hydrolase-like protein [Caballeronia pedi]
MRKLISSVFLCLLSSTCHSAGVRLFDIPAAPNGPALQAAVWTPCADVPEQFEVGTTLVRGTRDCSVTGENLPLVVMSHGHGGSRLGHHDLAEKLADAGFVVAAINHPGDTSSDMSRASEPSEFVERPIDIQRLIDYMLDSSPEASKINARNIGFFGFSRGGFTGLVLAGGVPDFQHADIPCPDELPICKTIREGKLPPQHWTRDPRIRVFVLADPLDAFPTPATVQNISAPIQLWASEYGGDGVLPETTPALSKLLPTKPEYHLVAGAAHFAFLSPCTPKQAASVPRVCVDDGGFDRVAFHARFNEAVLRFFQTRLR